MAETIADDAVAVHDVTVGSSGETVNIQGQVTRIGILSAAGGFEDTVFYTVNGDAASINGDDCYMIPAGATAEYRDVLSSAAVGPACVVKLVAATDVTVSVQREDDQ